ncbi:DNA-3-methyladenine glycosylase [Lapidilactobacillus bayanensis]|uniref:DNA-3-methyladenine glycosylase n=1 Tax=Lapidilactobacillus bayanensis TaxID=2485998 RepID=UPI000F770330|nr:DNA-3-methyladenine glycosylase [Lapidilactobacillus bayanensis]
MESIANYQVLPNSFFTNRPTETIAQDLLGKLLIYNSPAGQVGGYIVEAEAYLGTTDPGAHAYQGKHGRANDPLYGEGGIIYIYAIRGFYAFDVVTQIVDQPEGVLIRGIQPLLGEDIMRQNRTRPGFELSNGPGKLMQALNIHDTKMNYQHFADSPIKIIKDYCKTPQQIVHSPRIGVRTATSWQDHYRYFVAGNPYVSKMRKREIDFDHYGWKNELS